MKPYYQDESVQIFHADCRDVLPTLGDVDLVLTDPPYGIGLPTDFKSRRRGGLADCRRNYLPIEGDSERIDVGWLLSYSAVVLWGGNYFANQLPPKSGWLVWDKRVTDMSNDQADCELAWTNCVKGVRIFRHMWNGFLRDSERGTGYHPAQKPVDLMRWCLSLVPDAEIILDPYMGAGPVLRAAKDLGHKAIGIEIEERYCEIAAKRMSQTVMAL